MLQGTRTKKAVAATLLTILLTNTIAPTVTYALTSGPTAPEATSFEPIDTTDMIHLQTGDLTYNMPLLEVPGPEGGYPLSLSYHAGIQPNEDASWVGLGWSLNPGAITRNVNGYPDDWYVPTNSAHTYWSGGTTSTYNIGVNIGIANTPATVGFGLSFSQDTYKGFGVGFSASVGGRIGGANSPLSVGVTIGVSPYGGGYVGGGLGIGGGKSITTSLGIGFQTNFESFNVGLNASVGYSFKAPGQTRPMGGSLLGASIKSGGGKPSLEVGGLTQSVSSTTQAGIQTSSSGFDIDIPVWYGINLSLGFNKTRYWIDKTSAITAHGALYTSGWGEGSNHEVLNDVAYDTYSLLENPEDKNIVEYPDPTTVQGGAYLDYDMYNVTAQGLGGNMRPYIYKAEVLGQNRKAQNGNALVTYYSPGVTDPQPSFRFIGDFSNSYRQNYPVYSNPNLNLRLIDPPFDPSPVYGNNDGNYGLSGTKLAGSKHIDVGVKIQPSNIAGYVKTDRYKSFMIDGFSITNESGVTYHYGLPAYSWDEENYQEKISRSGGLSFNRSTKPEAYAYTWYLTSITGPDFVDRNNNQQADAADWGYWINLEYGKWSNNYVWRNPSEGYHRDEDNEFQNCSMGRKEIYYLNAIRTRSHIALFEKDVRTDGKGASIDVFTKNSSNQDYTYAGDFDYSSVSSMQLNHIYVMNISDATLVANNSGNGNTNVLDVTDLNAVGRSFIESKAIRIMDFNYDYSLCNNTTNSFMVMGQYKGKLTLLSVNTRGKGGAHLLPPTKFQYDLGSDAVSQSGATLTAVNGSTPANFTTTNGNFNVGDLVNCDLVSGTYYGGVITAKSLAGSTWTYTLVNCTYTGSPGAATVTTTKNPSYNKNAYDTWGMYKCDINSSLLATNENMARQTTALSSKSVDAWSLRKIITNLGSEINIRYEGKDYQKAILARNQSGVINTISKLTETTFRIEMLGTDIDLRNYFTTGNTIDALLLKQQSVVFPGQDPQPIGYSVTRTPEWSPQPVIIGTVNANNITLQTNETMMKHIFESVGTVIQGVPAALVNSARGGNLNLAPTNNVFYGGGLRVRSIELNTLGNMKYSTVYNYSVPGQSLSSGVTSYEPVLLEIDNVAQFGDDAKKLYRKELYKKSSYLYSIARELPSPGVLYEYVTVTSEVKNADEASSRQTEGKTQYQFEVFRENMVGREQVGTQQGSNSLGTYYVRNLAMKKFTGSIGNIKRIIQYDKDGRKISETINQYLHDGLENLPFQDFMTQYKNRLAQFFYQGYLQERYAEVKEVSNQSNAANNGVKATLSAREEYPCIQLGQTVINNLNGTRTASENITFDFYSGAVTKTVETDALGNRFLTEVTPAYRKYASLGLKLTDGNNKNMLTQTTASYVYKADGSNNKLGLVSAQVTVWSNALPVIDKDGNSYVQNNLTNGNVWRSQSTWQWQPDGKTADGLTATGNFVDFNWTTPGSSNANWKKASEITLYDVYSKPLEIKDINDNYAATRMGYNNTKVVLSGGPANYYEIAYSGAEDEGVNQSSNLFVKRGSGSAPPNLGIAHTGKQSLLLPPNGNKGFIYTVATNNLKAGRSYTAGVWVRGASVGASSNVQLYYSLNGTVQATSISSGTSTKKVGDWAFISLTIPGTAITAGNTLEVGCINNDAAVSFLDDFRFQPFDAHTIAYVYDTQTGELTHMLNNNNLYTRYEYDAVGRLVRTYQEKLNVGELKLTENQYNMAACEFRSSEMSQTFTKNNCGAELTGSMVVYTIPAGTYCSSISGADANSQATRDLQANGQQYANNRGVCLDGGIIRVNAVLPVGVPVSITAHKGSIFAGNFICFNGTSYINLPPDTYIIQVTQTDNVSRTVGLTGFSPQASSNVVFNNVSIGTTQLTITIN